jgi:hypothetical protein
LSLMTYFLPPGHLLKILWFPIVEGWAQAFNSWPQGHFQTTGRC